MTAQKKIFCILCSFLTAVQPLYGELHASGRIQTPSVQGVLQPAMRPLNVITFIARKSVCVGGWGGGGVGGGGGGN